MSRSFSAIRSIDGSTLARNDFLTFRSSRPPLPPPPPPNVRSRYEVARIRSPIFLSLRPDRFRLDDLASLQELLAAPVGSLLLLKYSQNARSRVRTISLIVNTLTAALFSPIVPKLDASYRIIEMSQDKLQFALRTFIPALCTRSI